MKTWYIDYPTLTEFDTTHPNWNRQLSFGGRKYSKWVLQQGMMVGDNVIIKGGDGDYLGTIEDLGDPEFGENWMIVDLM